MKDADRTPFTRPLLLLVAGAVGLRLVLLLGRGHYVAFDEGWYLLLGRNLWAGDGYTLSGLRHVALSPLFPVLAGALDLLVGNAVWAGRIVAAVASGLLVLPCWYLFHRLAGPAAAKVGTLFVALMPSLAPFVVPYWIGWDLWVGAEPLLHLFLFGGLALFLRAWDRGGIGTAITCGVAFALAYLARPEAIGTFGLLGLLAVVVTLVAPARDAAGRPGPRTRFAQIAACAVAFAVVAAPYWIYLHDSLGRWTVTGRGVRLVPRTVTPSAGRNASANRIETMLWEGDSSPYLRRLYALNASGTALASSYWGVGPENGRTDVEEPSATGDDAEGEASPEPSSGAAAVPATDTPADPRPASRSPPGPSGSRASPSEDPGDGTSWMLRYGRALGVAVPGFLWLFVVPGLVGSRRDRSLLLEGLVGIPLLVTGVAIARMVAVDPRTQLLLAPLAALYAGRGALVVADAVKARAGDRVREGMVTGLLVGMLALALFSISALRLGLSLAVGSPHHVVAEENAAVGAAIRAATPEDATVMSWHPALALFANRDWRVLPLEPMERIVRYARTQPDPAVVLSVFYPPMLVEREEPHYLIVSVPSDIASAERWRIDIPERRTVYAFGRLVPVD